MSDAWRGHLNKWEGFFARLLLVFHMLDHWPTADLGDTTNKGLISICEDGRAAVYIPASRETAERAYRFAGVLLAHAIRFYETIVGLGASGDSARRAAGIILTRVGASTLSRRELYEAHRNWRPGERDASELFEAMRILERHGWCRPVFSDDRNIEKWEINPEPRRPLQGSCCRRSRTAQDRA